MKAFTLLVSGENDGLLLVYSTTKVAFQNLTSSKHDYVYFIFANMYLESVKYVSRSPKKIAK